MVLDICGKRTYEYIFESLAKLNRQENITLRAIGGNVSKGMTIASMLGKLNVDVENIKLKPLKIGEINTYFCDIELRFKKSESISGNNSFQISGSDFVNIEFPVYHLLLDWWLYETKSLKITLHQNEEILKISERDGTLTFEIKANNSEEISKMKEALSRSGAFMPKNWKEIALEISKYDDVILGVDTNVLNNCSLDEHLLPSLTFIGPTEYIHTPNWTLITVPNSVMHELEEAANIRDDKGKLEHDGRMGFRALQEIIELNQSADIIGVSILVIGEANPVLDTRVELQGLRQDFRRLQGHLENQNFITKKSSSGDMIIRDQFKNFLKQINFHKGTYFLTADKSNAALARAEGLHPIYFWPGECYYQENYYSKIRGPKIERNEKEATSFLEEYKINECESPVKFKVPIGKLIYEMAVEFGTIDVGDENRSIRISCDIFGRSLDNWFYRRLQIKRQDFETLLSKYKGKFELQTVSSLWNTLLSKFAGVF